MQRLSFHKMLKLSEPHASVVLSELDMSAVLETYTRV